MAQASKVTSRKAPQAVSKKTATAKAAPTKKSSSAVAKKSSATKVVAKPAAKSAAKPAASKSAAKKAVASKPSPAKSAAKKQLTKPAGAKSATKKAPAVATKKVEAKKAAPAKKVAPAASAVKKAPAAPTKGPMKVANKPTAAPAVAKPVAVKPAPVKKEPPPKKLPPPLAQSTLDKLRELLEEERASHVLQAEVLEASAERLASERDQGDTQFDEESGEGDTVSVERERDLSLSTTARQMVDDIDRALERIPTGMFGVCITCLDRIPVARLEVIPWAEQCVKCKARGERRR
jgi:RNA polymerase-binding transcription factor DksA